MDVVLEPKLAPPGAGLPKVELFVARLQFAWRRRTGSRERFIARFREERAAIATLLRASASGSHGQRVLIQRLRGLEDSSRYWSVWMTLDHLRIVHGSMTRVIAALAKGVVPEGKSSTAAVKPSSNVSASVVAEYEQSCEAFLTGIANVAELNTTACYAHPWFGPLNAYGWLALAGGHLGIHRRQIRRILDGLPRSGH